MSQTDTRQSGTRAKRTLAPPEAPSPDLASTRVDVGREIEALIELAEVDAAGRDGRGERSRLAAKLSPEVLDAYQRALRAGRQPAVVRLVGSVCSGCHMRLHSKLDHQIRQRSGVAPCPRCLRLVYDPAWLGT